jgi:biopolymer transport protein ExbD
VPAGLTGFLLSKMFVIRPLRLRCYDGKLNFGLDCHAQPPSPPSNEPDERGALHRRHAGAAGHFHGDCPHVHPRGHSGSQRIAGRTLDAPPLEVVLDAGDKMQIKDGDKVTAVDSRSTLASQVAAMLAGADRPVAISADKDLKYADVVSVADDLHKAGIKRVALTVKQQNHQ